MAINYRGEGVARDFPYIIQSGITITAGSLIWADVSGTNVVHRVRSYSGTSAESAAAPTGLGIFSIDMGASGQFSSVFLGVLANTQTGVSYASGGTQTGITFFRKGVFELLTTPTASSNLRIGYNAYAVDHQVVRGAQDNAVNLSGSNSTATLVPVGRVVGFMTLPPATSAAQTRVYVAIDTDKVLDGIL